MALFYVSAGQNTILTWPKDVFSYRNPFDSCLVMTNWNPRKWPTLLYSWPLSIGFSAGNSLGFDPANSLLFHLLAFSMSRFPLQNLNYFSLKWCSFYTATVHAQSIFLTAPTPAVCTPFGSGLTTASTNCSSLASNTLLRL